MNPLFKMFNTVPLNQKIAAWGTAGVVFGAWQWYESKDDGQEITRLEQQQINKSIAGKLKKEGSKHTKN